MTPPPRPSPWTPSLVLRLILMATAAIVLIAAVPEFRSLIGHLALQAGRAVGFTAGVLLMFCLALGLRVGR